MPIDNIPWGTILGQSTEPPSELKVVSGANWRHLSDQQLTDRIASTTRTLSSKALCKKLDDGGARLKNSLREYEAEWERRKRRERKDANENGMSRRSENKEPFGSCHDSNLRCTTTEANLQSDFASLLNSRLEKRAVRSSNGECRSTEKDKSGNLEGNGQSHDRRKRARTFSSPARIPSRSSPFPCILSNRDKKPSSTEDCRVTKSANSLSAQKDLPIRFSKRKKESDKRLDSVSKKVTVVLLDEEEEEEEEPELEPEQKIPSDAYVDWKETKVYYPSRDDPQCVELSSSDIECLDPEKYVTSPIMNFYIRYLQRPVSQVGKPRGEYHIFNTYFFSKLEDALSFCKGERDECFMKLRRWLKGVNIFQKAYIFLPIHRDMHWSLVIICIPSVEDESGPIVLHLDSLEFHASTSILDLVICYLKEEWNNIKKNGAPTDLPISDNIWRNLPRNIEKKTLTVPQQKNDYDCGLFVLYFMERFIKEAPERLRKKDLDKFGSNWFQPEEASGLRKRIRELLMEEFESARLETCKDQEDSPTSSSNSPKNDEDHED